MGATIIGGAAGGITMALAYGVLADNVDYIEDKIGIRAEGAVASINSFIVKCSMGIGGAIPGYILAFTGYVPDQAQSEAVTEGIVFGSITVPALLGIIGAVIFIIGYPITKVKLDEIGASLRLKREGVAT
jgi:GPH family glycoside/pentoside/hexuronide:cation symporter/glucuronide carrier protein